MVIIYHPIYGVGHLWNRSVGEQALQMSSALVSPLTDSQTVSAYFPTSHEVVEVSIMSCFELDWTTMFRREPE